MERMRRRVSWSSCPPGLILFFCEWDLQPHDFFIFAHVKNNATSRTKADSERHQKESCSMMKKNENRLEFLFVLSHLNTFQRLGASKMFGFGGRKSFMMMTSFAHNVAQLCFFENYHDEYNQ